MRAAAYSVKPFEKDYLLQANGRKHDLKLISDKLDLKTAHLASGYDAVLVFTNDDLSRDVIDKLAAESVKYISTRSTGTDHIDKEEAGIKGLQVANIPSYSPQAIAELAVALAFGLNRQLIKANRHSHDFDFRNDGLIGFNFSGKTVGLIGLGSIGLAASRIFHGLGCKIVGYDLFFPETEHNVTSVSLDELLETADVISLHVPLTPSTKYLVSKERLEKMKTGVMLINTSRGAVINTLDVLDALEKGKIGYLGLDVYEHEKGLFFEDHEFDTVKDSLLEKLLNHPNVLITPHQGYLTKEALQEIAHHTIANLDGWELVSTSEK